MLVLRTWIGAQGLRHGGFIRKLSRAAFLNEHGKQLNIQEFDPPEKLEEDQVEIAVKYCSLNSNDVKFLEEGRHPVPYIPGYELSGEVSRVGSDVDNLKAGDRVVAIAPKRCGGLASRISLGSQDVWPLPSELSSKDAAALVFGHTTALLAFSEKRPLNEGETVLIIAGAGGFGLAAVDIAAGIFKAKVIALADTEGKASLLRDRGAFAAFKNDSKHNFKEIMKVTNNEGVDVIYDAVGGKILNTVIKCLKEKEKGSILTTYWVEELESKDDDDDKKGKIDDEVIEKLETVSLTQYRREDQEKYYSVVEQVLQFCTDGLINAHISKDFQLEQINEAIDYIKGKMCTGKVLIDVANKPNK